MNRKNVKWFVMAVVVFGLAGFMVVFSGVRHKDRKAVMELGTRIAGYDLGYRLGAKYMEIDDPRNKRKALELVEGFLAEAEFKWKGMEFSPELSDWDFSPTELFDCCVEPGFHEGFRDATSNLARRYPRVLDQSGDLDEKAMIEIARKLHKEGIN